MKFKIALVISLIAFSLSAQEALYDSGRVVTHGDQVSIFVEDKPSFLSIPLNKITINFNKENIYFDLLIEDIKDLEGVELRLSENKKSKNYARYTFPLFSDKEFSFLQNNTWVKYGLGLGHFENFDSKAKYEYLTFYIKSKSENTLKFNKLVTKKKQSSGIVTITFDDGYKNNIQAYKILKKYNLPATLYIMPRDVGKGKEYLDVTDLKKFQESQWDIQFHHSVPFTYMSLDHLDKEYKYMLEFFKRSKLKINKGRHFAYPLGKWNKDVLSFVSKKFDTARFAAGGHEVIPIANNHMIRAYNVLNSTTVEELRNEFSKAKQHGHWLILMFHNIKSSPTQTTDFGTLDFEKVMKELSKVNVDVMTMEQVWKKYLK